jgi:hypothetical protein
MDMKSTNNIVDAELRSLHILSCRINVRFWSYLRKTSKLLNNGRMNGVGGDAYNYTRRRTLSIGMGQPALPVCRDAACPPLDVDARPDTMETWPMQFRNLRLLRGDVACAAASVAAGERAPLRTLNISFILFLCVGEL